MCTSLIISTTYFTADIKAIIRCDREMVFCFLTCRNEVVCCWQQGECSRWLTGYRPASEGKATGWSCVHVVRSGCDAVVHCSLWYWITKRQHLESQKRLVNKLHTRKLISYHFLTTWFGIHFVTRCPSKGTHWSYTSESVYRKYYCLCGRVWIWEEINSSATTCTT